MEPGPSDHLRRAAPWSKTNPVPKAGGTAARYWRPLLIAAAVFVLLFVIGEVVERLWLEAWDEKVLLVLHFFESLLGVLTTATLLGWLMTRAAPAPPVHVADGGAMPSPHLTDEQWTSAYVCWFVEMRWLAVAMSGLLAFLAVKIVTVGGMPLLAGRTAMPLALTIGALGFLNLLYHEVLRWWHGPAAGLRVLLLLQIYVDLLFLVVLLHFSGGIENPLSLLMVFHVIIGGVVLTRRQCYTVAAAASVLFAALAAGEWSGFLSHYPLLLFPHLHLDHEVIHAARLPLYVAGMVGLQTTILFLTAYFVTTLAERMRYDERQLTLMADRATAQRQLLEQALETTETGLRLLDAELRPFWSNNRWNVWLAADRPADPATRQTLDDHAIHVVEITFPAGGAAPPRVLQLTVAPLLDAAGAVAQVIELVQDVTVQRATQAQLLHAGKLAAVGELAGQVAHEVNNPIAVLTAKARLLLRDRRGEMSDQVAGELAKITDHADRVARIAQGLLSYCRPSTGTRVPLDLCGPIRKALEIVEPRCRALQVRMADRLPESLPLVQANAGEIGQVFLNLFLNAVDAMPGGGSLTVTAESDAADLRLLVRDTGGGIAPAVRDRIFEPFFSTKPPGRGTGLGLSICLGLVQSHGGRIEVASQVGQGSTFTVRLPLAAPAPGPGTQA